MRPRLSWVLALSCLAPQGSPVPAIGAEPPLLSPASKITHVTVYEDLADVRRVAEDVHLPAGRSIVEFASLPARTDASSIRASGLGEGNVTLLNVDVKRGVAPPAEAPESLRSAQEETEARIRDLESRRTALAAGRQFLDSVRLSRSQDAAQVAESGAGTAWLGETLTFLTEAMERNGVETARNEEEIRRLRARSSNLEREMMERGNVHSLTWDVRLELESAAPATVDLVLEYATGGASWSTDYDIVVPESLDSVRIVYGAQVVQGTGEDWNGVALTLSTAQPGLGARLPRLEPWWLSIPVPVVPTQAGAVASERSYVRGGRSSEVSTKIDQLKKEESGSIRVIETKEQSRLRAINTTEEAIATSAAVPGGGELATSFDVPDLQTLPSDGRSRRLRIASFEVQGELRHESAPKIAPFAYLVATVRNTSELPLLAGPTRVMLGGSFLGKGALDNVAPGDEFPLSLGVDRAVTVERKVSRRRDDRSGSRQESEVAFRIDVANRRAVPVKLTLRDQLPMSPDKDVSVRARDVSPDPSRGPGDDGLLEWKLEIPAGGRQDVEFGYDVRYPADRRPRNL